MPTLILLRGLQISRTNSAVLRSYHVGRAASVDTAIAKGIRKSNGIGLRGKSKPPENDARGKYIERKGLPAFTPKSKDVTGKKEKVVEPWKERGNIDTRIRRGKKDIKPERTESGPWASGKKGSESSRGGHNDDRKGFPDRSSFDRLPARGGDKRPGRDHSGHSETTNRGASSRFGDQETGSRLYKSEQADRPNQSSGKYPSLQGGRRDQDSSQLRTSGRSNNFGKERGDRSRFDGGRREESGSDKPRKFEEKRTTSEPLRDSFESKPPSAFFNRRTGKFEPRSSDGSYRSHDRVLAFSKPQESSRDNESTEPQTPSSLIRRTNKFDPRSSENSYRSNDRPSRFSRSPDNRRNDDPAEQQTFTSPLLDRNIPLSIPYTTPASEFLYGASVVEAALSSRRIPRRKLYKLYIYTGENRENPQQDLVMERLAKTEGVPVVKVAGEWIRLLDKMSTGRPHNGYILEASPLPRLPILSLGGVAVKDGLDGFEVVLDHQSREDALVNGTGTFIRKPVTRSRRNPLVLYLDSITDPGNLGGIIRTAAFLGVSAVGISTRNSAPFTPVVLKASAGASENVTIFSVNKPAGFIVDSKAAGWKVYAAVAPLKKKDPNMPASISTDLLNDPLAEHPCILMLGSEGEGLRWNLRSKADSDLYIKGSGQSYNVDSLNVSVATGLLCNAFLSRRGALAPKKGEVAEAKEVEDANEVEDSMSLNSDPTIPLEIPEEVEADTITPGKGGSNALF